jgi:hypothetical protein
MKVTLVLMVLMFVILANFQVDGSLRKRKKLPSAMRLENTEILNDQSQDPKTIRTKILMIKKFVTAVLDQLDIPDMTIEKSLNVSARQLIAVLDIFKDISRGHLKGKDLINLEKHLKLENLSDKLEDDSKVNNAVELIKTYLSQKDLN